MSCTTLKNLLDQAASPADIDRLVADFGYRSHLDACPSCRAEFAAARQMLDFFARQKANAATVPEEEIQATRVAILRAVAECEPRAPRAFLPTWLSDLLLSDARLPGGLVRGPAIAAVVVIAVGVVEFRRGQHASTGANPASASTVPAPSPVREKSGYVKASTRIASTQTPAPTQSMEVASSAPAVPVVVEKRKLTLAESFENAQGPKEALALLQNAFDSAKQNIPGADFLEILSLCERVISRWNESDEGLEARKLVARCHEQLGDPMQAHTAFLTYADEAGARVKQRMFSSNVDQEAAAKDEAHVVSDIILAEANRLFDAKDYTQSLTFGDDLIARYPQTEPARQAERMVGEYCLRTRQPAQAAQTFKAIIQEAPDGPAAQMAQIALPSALFNAGRQAEAVKTWQDVGAKSTDKGTMACAYYNSAVLVATRGSVYYAEALQMFAKVVQDYPDSIYASLSKEAMNKLKTNILDGMKILDM